MIFSWFSGCWLPMPGSVASIAVCLRLDMQIVIRLITFMASYALRRGIKPGMVKACVLFSGFGCNCCRIEQHGYGDKQ